MPHVTHLSIWVIPEVVHLPTPAVEALQVLSDLLPYASVSPDDPTLDPAQQRGARILDFEAWTAHGARLGLLRWPERDAIVTELRSLNARP